MVKSREIQLKRYVPEGCPTSDDFSLVEVELPDISQGEVLVENLWMSVDPYMRSLMFEDMETYFEPFQLGKAMGGGAIGQVVESQNASWPVGTHVIHMQGWREYCISDCSDLQTVGSSAAPLQAYLGTMGLPGMTAYFGILHVGRIKAGDTVFVSAAGGAVGSTVCQIAKLAGCRVVGSDGSEEKLNWLENEIGIDKAINYKTTDSLASALAKACPEGIDVCYDSVGGETLEAALANMKEFGTVVIGGQIAFYQDETKAVGPKNFFQIGERRLRVQGLLKTDFDDKQAEFEERMGKWIAEGKVQLKETIHKGIDKAPEAFIGLFQGSNLGKMLVKLSEGS